MVANDRDARGIGREAVSYLDGDRLMIYEEGDNWGDGTPHIIGNPVEVEP